MHVYLKVTVLSLCRSLGQGDRENLRPRIAGKLSKKPFFNHFSISVYLTEGSGEPAASAVTHGRDQENSLD